jgi:hypothetical protein
MISIHKIGVQNPLHGMLKLLLLIALQLLLTILSEDLPYATGLYSVFGEKCPHMGRNLR